MTQRLLRGLQRSALREPGQAPAVDVTVGRGVEAEWTDDREGSCSGALRPRRGGGQQNEGSWEGRGD